MDYYRKLILFPKKARGVKNAVGNISIRGQISDFIMFNLVIRKKPYSGDFLGSSSISILMYFRMGF